MRAKMVMKQGSINSQKGALLIVGLVMVLLLSIIALSAIRGSGLQEMMAGNMYERNLAFQAAESALRDCENVNLASAVPLPPADCVDGKGLCGDLDATPQNSVISNDDYWRKKARAISAVANIPGVYVQPTCLIEALPITDPEALADAMGAGRDLKSRQKTGLPMPYRVTAQGVGGAKTASVVTQSTYNREF